jgi:Rad3-related DNA helicase
METLGKEFSTYEKVSIRIPSFNKWLQDLQTHSNKCKKYGSFLPSQRQLLKQVHQAIADSDYRVVTFTAPPASGKTHIITLCAAYLHSRGVSTCIVTPNNELKLEFKNELQEVNYKFRETLPVMNVGAFIRKRQAFDYALVDEAHNLRSAVELDENVVRSIHLEAEDPVYHEVLSHLRNERACVTAELSAESAHDIIERIKGSESRRIATQILRTLSQWRSFCILSDTTCDLKFLSANPERRTLLPKGRLFLFSATLLDADELSFYCNISINDIRKVGKTISDFVPKKNVIYSFVTCKTRQEKKDFAKSVLRNFKFPTAILVNNNAACLEWSRALSSRLKDRVVTISSGLNYTERLKIYKKFISQADGILLTSSSAYWEGVSIRNLRLLIIPEPPFPQPTLLEIAERKHTQYHRIAKRRLIQGIGRIGRSPKDSGMCLLLFRPHGLIGYIKEVTKEQAKNLIADLN